MKQKNFEIPKKIANLGKKIIEIFLFFLNTNLIRFGTKIQIFSIFVPKIILYFEKSKLPISSKKYFYDLSKIITPL